LHSERLKMEDKLRQICQQSLQLFLDNGIRSISMDEISRHMRISKKTLYQYVSNKEDLIARILEYIRLSHEQGTHKKWVEGKNAIEVLFVASRKIYDFQCSVKNPFRFELEKYYPQLWSEFENNMRIKTYAYLCENMQQGIKEGLYRSDLDIELTATLYMAKIDGVHQDFAKNPEKYTYRHLFEVLFEHHIRAIATAEGLEFLESEIQMFKIKTEK
jgi:TetR/AcrR family transcriptional regulator, cholesterol catabolism regulator